MSFFSSSFGDADEQGFHFPCSHGVWNLLLDLDCMLAYFMNLSNLYGHLYHCTKDIKRSMLFRLVNVYFHPSKEKKPFVFM